MADTAVRAKYTLVSGPDAGFAIAAEVRLPTGDTANLLGAGSTAFRLVAVGSAERAHLGIHGNGAFVWGGVSDEADLRGAMTYAVSPRVTATGELLWRRFADLREVTAVSAPHPTIVGVDTLRLVPGDQCHTALDARVGRQMERRLDRGNHRSGAMAAWEWWVDRADYANNRVRLPVLNARGHDLPVGASLRELKAPRSNFRARTAVADLR